MNRLLYVILTLFTISFILYLVSFALKDRFKDLEEQVEQVQLTTMQDSYQLKKKMRVLEEELLVDDFSSEMISNSNKAQPEPQQTFKQEETNQPPLVHKVLHMYNQGYTTTDIASETSLNEHDILTTLRQFTSENEQKGARR